MDKTNLEKKYLCTDKVEKVQWENIELRDDSQKQVNVFVKNNLSMANNWLGVAGDAYLFAANTLSGYLTLMMELYDQEQDLLGNYKLAFEDIDSKIMEIMDIEIN